MTTNSQNRASNDSSKKIQSQFMESLYNLIDSQEHSQLINWADFGDGLTIHKPNLFAEIVLPILCKRSNLASFVRQLNMYHFKKLKAKSSTDSMTYSNPLFVKGKPELLKSIVRKNPRQILAQKQARLQALGIESTLSNFSRTDFGPQEHISCSETIKSQPIERAWPREESQKEILNFMNQIINDMSSQSDKRTMAMIRNYLKDDDEDIGVEEEEYHPWAYKKIKQSAEDRYSAEKFNPYVQLDFDSLDLFSFESNQTKASLNSNLSEDSMVLPHKDYLRCQNLISNLLLPEKVKNDQCSYESDFTQGNVQDLMTSRTDTTEEDYYFNFRN